MISFTVQEKAIFASIPLCYFVLVKLSNIFSVRKMMCPKDPLTNRKMGFVNQNPTRLQMVPQSKFDRAGFVLEILLASLLD